MKKRGADHILAQKKGKTRDRNVCQICGSRIQPQGHHIVDYRYGGSADMKNIITLCRECHRKVHTGGIDLIVF